MNTRDRLAERLGADLIAAERKRQIAVEGWSAEHDGEHGHAHQLMSAGQAYLRNDHTLWPWHDGWKPKGALRNLVRAGALFQAALDTGDLVALSSNAEGFRNVCARLIDELLAEVADALLPVVEQIAAERAAEELLAAADEAADPLMPDGAWVPRLRARAAGLTDKDGQR